MTNRADIKTALNDVPGVQGHEYRPGTPRPGDGWPLSSGFARVDDAPMFVVTWRIMIVLPQDERAASDWLDEFWADLVDALTPVVFVSAIDPVEMSVRTGDGAGTLFALQITARSE